jgi:hypothetical protein
MFEKSVSRKPFMKNTIGGSEHQMIELTLSNQNNDYDAHDHQMSQAICSQELEKKNDNGIINSQNDDSPVPDPSDSVRQRSISWNIMFGVFMAAAALTAGYQIAIMNPFGEKFLIIHYGILPTAATSWCGILNVMFALGAMTGSLTSGIISN